MRERTDHVAEAFDRTRVDEIRKAHDGGLHPGLRERAEAAELIVDGAGVDARRVLLGAGSARPQTLDKRRQFSRVASDERG